MKLRVIGGKKLCGSLKVQGAKNSVLPILAACVLCKGEVVLHNCPALSDVDSALKILSHLGLCFERNGEDIIISCNGVKSCEVPSALMSEMRSSVVFLGPILASAGCAVVSMPGGCELGPRPIDMHLSALKKLGAEIKDEYGMLKCTVNKGLKGADIALIFPSVGATENAMLAATLASGTTHITNAAREPEIVDLANFLNACGARVFGAGSSSITVEGVKRLFGCEYSIMPDRIAAATFLTAGAITGGDINLVGAKKEHIISVLSLLEQAGCEIYSSDNEIRLTAKRPLQAMNIIKTLPYPGFPTDAQAPLMSLATVCEGSTMFVETIFENRFRHVCELLKMGADIKTEGKVAVVNGVKMLKSATLNCTDLRGGAAVLLAALSADGESEILEIHHIDRGYSNIEKDFERLGACVLREE